MTTPLDTLRAARARHIKSYARSETRSKHGANYSDAMEAMESWLLFHGVRLERYRGPLKNGWIIIDLATGDIKFNQTKYFALTAITRLRPDLFEDQP